MVRKTSRLGPGQQSVEEILLYRSIQQPHALRAPRETIRRRLSSNNNTGIRTSAASSRLRANHQVTTTRTELTEAPHLPVDSIQQMAIEIASLDQRLQCVATCFASASSHAAKARKPKMINFEHHIEPAGIINFCSIQKEVNGSNADDSERKINSVDAMGSLHKQHCVRDMESTARRLDNEDDEETLGDKKGFPSATKFLLMCRGYVVRLRFKNFYFALGRWRSRKCNLFLNRVLVFAAREELINRKITLMRQVRTHNLLHCSLACIRNVVLMELPSKMARFAETDYRLQDVKRKILKLVFIQWKMAALGLRSRKNVAADYRARHYAARQRLEATKRFKFITQNMVFEECRKDIMRQIRFRHPMHVLKSYFGIMKNVIFIPFKKFMEIAISHDHRRILKRVLDEWIKVHRAAQFDKAIGRPVTLKQFDQHLNIRKIYAHYRRKHMLKHLLAWARYGRLIRRVRWRFEACTQKKMTWLLERWSIRARYQHTLRDNVVEEWHAYSRRMYTIPFRRWYVFMACKRTERTIKDNICSAYQSRRRRRIKYTFFRLWVLQALFGNIEHMHSNACLLRSLEDQKRMCIELQTNAALYQSNIAELQASIVQLKGKLMEKQDELIQLHDSTQTTRFSIHQAAQNLERVQGMLDAVKTIHPGTIERIETMYKDNSPLVQDIHDLIILHAAKRRELLFEIELDQTESELRIASKKNDSQDDQMLLYRVKWVLSRLDLGMHKQNKCDYNTGMNGHCVDTFNMMCALFEFIRNGDTASLEPESNPKHYGKVQSNRGVGYTLQRNDFNCHVVCRSDVVDGSDTWDSFLQLLINKFVPNNMLAVRERLARRTAKLDAEANEAKAGLHLHHLYR